MQLLFDMKAKYYINYKISRQIKDLIPVLLSSLLSGGLIYLLMTYTSIHWILASIIFVIVYLLISYLFRIKAIIELVPILKTLLKKFKK